MNFLKNIKFFTNFRCPYCGKCFKQRMTYSAHISKHKAKEAKKFTCKQCDKSFNSNYYLNKHQAVHDKTVKKSLACTHCSKRLDIHWNSLSNWEFQLTAFKKTISVSIGIHPKNLSGPILCSITMRMVKRRVSFVNSVVDNLYHVPV